MGRTKGDEAKPPPSETLVALARSGDEAALGELLERMRAGLNRQARKLLSRALAQKVAPSDIVQDTCMEAMRDFRASRADSVATFETWLATLLENNIKDARRKFRTSQKRDLRRERPLADHESKLGLLDITRRQESADRQLISGESQQHLAAAIDRLPRGYQQIIVWRSQQRLPWKTIAARLDRSEDAVRMLWKRAVSRLKNILSQADGDA